NLRDYPFSAAEGDATNHEEARTIGLGPYANGLTENDLREELGFEERDNHATTCPADESHEAPEGDKPGKPDKPVIPHFPFPKPKPETPKPEKPGSVGGGILDALDKAQRRASRIEK
ncbi:MAG: hypothetical protein ACAI25_05985, partial [Planctomycetota bacterium]